MILYKKKNYGRIDAYLLSPTFILEKVDDGAYVSSLIMLNVTPYIS